MAQTELARWIEDGDLRRAASSLVVLYSEDVLATCTAMLRDRVAAEDVTQEVFDRAIRALSTFRGDASPRTWLLSIARNLCIDHLRARKREPWGGAGDEGGDPDAHADQAAFGSEWYADRSLVLHALDALAEGDRALVVLRFKNGLEYDELAAAFGLKEGTVRMRVSRALARMRTVLEPTEGAATMPPAAARPSLGHAPSTGAPPPLRAPAARPAAAALPPFASRGRALPGGFGGGPPPAAPRSAPAPSWWERLLGWLGGDDGADRPPPPAPPRPVGTLGLTLSAVAPSTPSEALLARLGALVEGAGGR